MYPFIATVKYCDELEDYKTKITNFVLYAENLPAAAKIVEDYMGDNILYCGLHYLAESGTLIEVDDLTAQNLIDKGGNINE